MIAKTIKTLLLAPLFLVLAFPVIAETQNPSTAATGQQIQASSAALACMQTAVTKRDNAIISAFDAFSASAKTALTARRDALNAAWGIANRKERKAAIKKAWDDFKNATKTARRTLNQARETAWRQFKTDALACKNQGVPTSDDIGSKSYENNL